MKKLFGIIALTLVFISIFGGTATAVAHAEVIKAEPVVESKARSAYLVDYNTGTVLYERNPDQKLPIASMVKIMTLVIAFDHIDRGVMTMNQIINVSDNAAGMGGSQMFLDAGKDYAVSDLIKGIVVCSANDASVAIAETISGTKEDFVRLMNETARSLGMNDTVFVNMTGLPEPGQHSTARDVTAMMRKLLSYHEYYKFSSIYMEDYKHPDGRITELVNTNKLVRFYKGCDAGKTGFTNEAMFCLSASALRNNMRVIATVVGSPDSKSRFGEVSGLFNYAFANYSTVEAVGGDKVTEIKVAGGKQEKIGVSAARPVFILKKKGDSAEFTIKLDIPEKIKAPVKKGTVIGRITVVGKDGNVIDTVDAVALEDVKCLTYGDSVRLILKNWFCGKRK
jgi:D-alanyl-D-alanine carboxypeptidase